MHLQVGVCEAITVLKSLSSRNMLPNNNILCGLNSLPTNDALLTDNFLFNFREEALVLIVGLDSRAGVR